MGLEKFYEFLDSEASLSNDRTKCAALEVPACVNGNGHGPCYISWTLENVMTADNPVDDKPRLTQCLENLPAINDRQASGAHTTQPRLPDGFPEVHLKGLRCHYLADTQELRG
jgi:hypothetical protein